MPYHTFGRILQRQATSAGLDTPVTPHSFRRSCATELIRSGPNVYHISDRLSHGYDSVDYDILLRAVERQIPSPLETIGKMQRDLKNPS